MSNLNYVAYISIRKNFLKSKLGDKFVGEGIEKQANDKQNENEKELGQKVKDLGIEVCLLKLEKEEIEMKYETLEEEKLDQEDITEKLFAKKKEIEKTYETLANENSVLKGEVINVKKEKEYESFYLKQAGKLKSVEIGQFNENFKKQNFLFELLLILMKKMSP